MPNITIKAKDASGEFSAYVALPTTTPAPAVIMIQEIFGVNEEMRKKCDEYAAQGYVAICPDLFWRIEPGIELTDKTEAEWEKAFDLFGKFDVDKGVEDLDATLAAAREHDDVDGPVGTVGYCLGGKLAYLMATRTDIDAAVGFYGVQINELVDEASNITKPLMLHVAEEDKFVDKDAQAVMREALEGHDKVEYHSYPGVNHAFARHDGEHYDDHAATLANQRTRDFLARHIAR